MTIIICYIFFFIKLGRICALPLPEKKYNLKDLCCLGAKNKTKYFREKWEEKEKERDKESERERERERKWERKRKKVREKELGKERERKRVREKEG